MTPRLVRGQNAPLTAGRVTVTVTGPGTQAALLLGPDGRARSSAHLVHAGQTAASGVSWTPDALHVDTAAVPAGVASVLCLVEVAGRPTTVLVSDDDGRGLVEHELDALTTETAAITVELYRRGPGWKVRAVGQGWDGGLEQAAREHGLAVALTPTPTPAPPGPAVEPEQLPRRVHAVWEDAARSTAAWTSACTFAEQRRERELTEALADPAARTSPAGAAARDRAERRHDELVARADAEHDRDVAQLVAELAGLAPGLAAPVADWEAPAWRTWTPATRRAPAVRLGTLHTDAAPTLQVPLLAGLPLRAPLWVDGTDGADAVLGMVRALVLRLLVAHPPGQLRLVVADPVGGIGDALGTAPRPLGEVLDEAAERVDLARMARQAGLGGGELPDAGSRLVVLHGLPHGLDERSLQRLRGLVADGPGAGVHLLVTGDRADLLGRDADGLLARLAEGFQRLPVTLDGTLRDPWVGHEWSFTPDHGPRDTAAADALVRRASGA